MPVMRNYSGRTFGRVTLSTPVPGKPGYWAGTCSCGSPVEKRIDNLKRPGVHSCGKCLTPGHAADANLEERVRRLEEVIALVKPGLPAESTPEPKQPLTPSVASEVRGPSRLLAPALASAGREGSPTPEPQASRYFGVARDGEFWRTRSPAGKVLFWGNTEEEAAYAARVYLEAVHLAGSRRVITDAELALPEDRRERIRHEVIATL